MTYTNEEIRNNRLEVIAALESEEYKQGFSWLRKRTNGIDCYCLEGVVADIYINKTNLAEWLEGQPNYFTLKTPFGNSGVSLPEAIYNWFGFNPSGVEVPSDILARVETRRMTLEHFALYGLIGLNDNLRLNFLEMAELFRRIWNLPREGD